MPEAHTIDVRTDLGIVDATPGGVAAFPEVVTRASIAVSHAATAVTQNEVPPPGELLL
ncbi:MAG TPA: hypothetical protein VKU86_11365 [Acidimicrobiales bacterium]|nr:hypothetical protein [Acidimicrobiales bacterium]